MSKVCLECGGEMVREVRKVPYTYSGQVIEVEQPGDWCNACGEGVLTVADMKATELELHDFRAMIDGLLPSYEVRKIRKKLNMTQKVAAEIFGGGPNAFSRYERGEAIQMKAVDNLLRLFDKHKELVAEVQNLAAEAKQAAIASGYQSTLCDEQEKRPS
ncbi:MAG: type II toxin-antitoxin system MqsA family antitoxin [Pseudomonadota bacterium]